MEGNQKLMIRRLDKLYEERLMRCGLPIIMVKKGTAGCVLVEPTTLKAIGSSSTNQIRAIISTT